MNLIRLPAAMLVLSVVSACATGTASQQPTPVTLQSVVTDEIGRPPLDHALWGILIEDEEGNVLAEHNASTLMMPASNRKVLVSAFASACLGLDATLPTELWIDGEVRDSVLHGNVILKGGADPSLGGRYEAHRDDRLTPFADALRAKGITRVQGNVVADVSLFSRETIPGSWKTNNLGASYAAPVDALAFNENVIGYRAVSDRCGSATITPDPNFPDVEAEIACGSEIDLEAESTADNQLRVRGTSGPEQGTESGVVAVDEPGLYAGQALKDFLERQGIVVDGTVRLNAEPREWKEKLAVIQSPPLFFLLTTVLKNSQNLYAEMLFRASAQGPAPIGYAEARLAERSFLISEAGLRDGEFYSADGSGLSPENMVTPSAMVDVFRYLYAPYRRHVFFSLLATPGESGTLRRRLTGLEDRMRGKTGTINGVSALSGYVLMSDDSVRFFSIIVNHHLSDSSVAEAAIDRIVMKLAELP